MTCIKCNVLLPEGAVFCHMCGKKQEEEKRKHTKRGNGTGTVYKRGDRWVAEVTKGYRIIDDTQRRVVAKKGGFRTKKEALEYLPLLKKQQRQDQAYTWKQLYDMWLPTHRAGKSTIDCYKAASKYFYPVEYLKIKEIEIDDLQECLDECPKGKRTRENMKALCGLIYKYAVPRGYAGMNLAQYLIVSGEQSEARSSFTAEHIEKLRKAIGTVPYADYVYCMCYLGFRPSELLTLDVKDYDRMNKTVTGGA